MVPLQTDAPEVAEVEADGEVRLCKYCKRSLPLKMFLAGPRLFICKIHMREIVRRGTAPLTADEKAARKICTTSYKDIQSAFGKVDSIRLTHRQILAILERAGQPPSSYCDVFILPLVPTEPLTCNNAILSGRATRKYLITLWRTKGDAEAYTRAVQQLSSNSLL